MSFSINPGETLIIGKVKIHFPKSKNAETIVVEADGDIEIVSEEDFRVSNRLTQYFDSLENK